MTKAYELKDGTIIINRKLTELDYFVKKFLDVLKKHCEYLIVSGYVSISTGRIRGTEDVDILFELLTLNKFRELFNELLRNDFWCYQGDNSEDVYEYVKNLNNIRFALKEQMFPNVELIPVNEKRKAKYFEFTHPQKVKIEDFDFKIPPIEFEILYKEILLAGKKDKEDAKHLRVMFKELLDEEKFREYGLIIKGELK